MSDPKKSHLPQISELGDGTFLTSKFQTTKILPTPNKHIISTSVPKVKEFSPLPPPPRGYYKFQSIVYKSQLPHALSLLVDMVLNI